MWGEVAGDGGAYPTPPASRGKSAGVGRLKRTSAGEQRQTGGPRQRTTAPGCGRGLGPAKDAEAVMASRSGASVHKRRSGVSEARVRDERVLRSGASEAWAQAMAGAAVSATLAQGGDGQRR